MSQVASFLFCPWVEGTTSTCSYILSSFKCQLFGQQMEFVKIIGKMRAKELMDPELVLIKRPDTSHQCVIAYGPT